MGVIRYAWMVGWDPEFEAELEEMTGTRCLFYGWHSQTHPGTFGGSFRTAELDLMLVHYESSLWYSTIYGVQH